MGFIETECGKPKNVGFELINAAKPLAQEKGCELIAVVIGKDIEGVGKRCHLLWCRFRNYR